MNTFSVPPVPSVPSDQQKMDLRDGILEASLLAAAHGGADGIDNNNIIGRLDANLCADGSRLSGGGLNGQVRGDLSKTRRHDGSVCVTREERSKGMTRSGMRKRRRRE